MIEFSDNLAIKRLPTTIDSEGDIDTLLNAFSSMTEGLNLWQYYVLDVSREKQAVKDALTSGKYKPWSGPDISGKSVVELAHIAKSWGIIKGLNSLSSRFCVKADAAVSAGMVKAAFKEITEYDALGDAWVTIVDVINVPLYDEWKEDARVAMENIKNRVRYTRLDVHGPKLGEITKLYVRSFIQHLFWH